MAHSYIIREGERYIYTGSDPPNCTGHIYKVLKPEILLILVRQSLVLMECLCGPDKGMVFCITAWNFSLRYTQLTEKKEHCKCREL